MICFLFKSSLVLECSKKSESYGKLFILISLIILKHIALCEIVSLTTEFGFSGPQREIDRPLSKMLAVCPLPSNLLPPSPTLVCLELFYLPVTCNAVASAEKHLFHLYLFNAFPVGIKNNLFHQLMAVLEVDWQGSYQWDLMPLIRMV